MSGVNLMYLKKKKREKKKIAAKQEGDLVSTSWYAAWEHWPISLSVFFSICWVTSCMNFSNIFVLEDIFFFFLQNFVCVVWPLPWHCSFPWCSKKSGVWKNRDRTSFISHYICCFQWRKPENSFPL